jgi:hypothetical protein
MNPELNFAAVDVQTPPGTASFALRRAPNGLSYSQLSLSDAQGNLAHWVIPMPLKQLTKRAGLLWQLPDTNSQDFLPCLESGAMQLAPAHPGQFTTLRDELAHGILRLNFDGQLLRGYYRLQCLPTGGGQLWQLIPIGHV